MIRLPAFNLRWFLFATLAIGCGGGMMLRLLQHDPRTFQWIVGTCASAVALLVLFGSALWAGMRKRSRWESPRCAACSEPLRDTAPGEAVTCTACRQTLTTLDQLRFDPVPKRDKRLLAAVAASLLLPIAGTVAWMVCFPSGRAYAPVPTGILIENHLRNTFDTPWVWRELEERASAGRLDAGDADEIFLAIRDRALELRITGGSLFLPWGASLLQDPSFVSLASDEALTELADAAFGLQPQLVIQNASDKCKVEISLSTTSGGLSENLGVQPVWALRELRVDGEPVNYTLSQNAWLTTPGGLVVEVESLTPGQTVGATIDAAYVRAPTKLHQFRTAPNVAKGQWAKPVHEWVESVESEFNR